LRKHFIEGGKILRKVKVRKKQVLAMKSTEKQHLVQWALTNIVLTEEGPSATFLPQYTIPAIDFVLDISGTEKRQNSAL
jgi:hypothetical protein